MLDRNALLFIGLQFGSRFANSFLVTAARYELLEAGGIMQFAGAQVATNVARMIVSQIAGLLTDNFALKRMYVASEACNLVLALAMLGCGHRHGGMLFVLNVGLGLLFAFSQPVTKSMPPAVAAREDLAVINGWDLTCDKVGRYLAPFAYAVVSSSHGFNFAVVLSCFMYAILAILRTLVQVTEPTARKSSKGRATVRQKLGGLLQQILDGIMSLRRDAVLRLLILNTLATNVFLYPLNSVHFPVLFKQVAERVERPAAELTAVDHLLNGVMLALDIKKKDMWRNYSALVSLGGVAGPFLSNALIYMLESHSSTRLVCRLWVGVNFGIVGQIVTMALLAVIVSFSDVLGAGWLVFNLVSAWIVTISVNNIVTTYFNSISQERLQHNERGRFIANIMTIFTLGSSGGTLLFGWVLSATGGVSGSVNLLICGLAVKIALLVRSLDAEELMEPSGTKRKAASDGDGSAKRPRGGFATESSATALAQRLKSDPALLGGQCDDFARAASGKWAELCGLGDKAKDELWYWEGYQALADEEPKHQLLRQVKQDFAEMEETLLELGASKEEAKKALCPQAVESLCEVLLQLLDLRQSQDAADDAKRFFALRIDINQEGCLKFHDDRCFTDLRLCLALQGPGPVLALPENVDWQFWESEKGLLNSEEDSLETIQNWNKRVCPSDKETAVPPGSLLFLRGGEQATPVLQRSSGADGVPARLSITLDYVTQDVKARLHAAVTRKRKADEEPPELQTRTYTAQRVLGKGSFGVVYQAQVLETGETVAIKSIKMQEKDREVQILKELDGHPNIVCLHGAFLSDEGTAGQGTRLNLVLEFLSDTLHRVIKHYNQLGKKMEAFYAKLYQFQLMRGLAFVHGRGIVHCDLKPQNLLLDGKSQTLKICDFGTAKRMIFGEPQRTYMVSRYYRAPELILGATNYTTAVDLWSAGCVFGELILGQPLFTGKDGIDQLVQIVKVLGTPSPTQLRAMNPNYPDYEFTPQITPHTWDKVLRGWAPPHACDLIGLMLTYDPAARSPPLHILLHPFFSELRSADKKEQCRMLFNFREDGQSRGCQCKYRKLVDLHVTHVPLSAPINYVGPRTICYAAANSVHLWDLEANSVSSHSTPAYAISKMCSNPEKGLIAFSEGGSNPQVFVYSCSPYKLLYTFPDLAELELADLAFSRCGSRLYALSRATSKKLSIFSMKTGKPLPGCELKLPLRFDKVCVYPGHKDHLAVVRSSAVRVVSITKSFETYIAKLQPSAIPSDTDLAVSAYCWTNTGHFLVATRQGALCTMDGATGSLLYMCQAEQPITSITLTDEFLVTSHIGNTLNFWELQPEALARVNSADVASFASGAASAPQMALSTGMFHLKKVVDLESVSQTQRLANRLLGQVASVQAAPNFKEVVLTTAEGEVWTMQLPSQQNSEPDEFEMEDDMYVRADQLQMELLTWFPANTVTCLCPIGTGLQVCASADEGGRLRLWQVIRGDDPKGFRLLRFASAVTSLTAESRGKFLLAGTDSGCIHAVAADPWTEAQVIDTQRISEVGIAKLCSTLSEDGLALKVAALLFDGRIAMASFSLREPKVRMLGLVENIGLVEDICFHEQEKAEDLNMPAKLLAVGSQTADVACMWSIRSPTEGYEPRELTIPREATGFWTVKLSSDTMEGRPTAICSISRNQAVVGFASGAVRIYSTPTHVGLMVKPNAANPVKSLLEPDTHHLITSLQMNLSATTLLVGCMDGAVLKFGLPTALAQDRPQRIGGKS
ncbi:unnamed protein product [Effrenium voratum]|nr:unnamed protein product [Effrenium voratum]